MFTYQRPNEISSTAGESFVAEGPTNEILDVYVSNKEEGVASLMPALCYFGFLTYINVLLCQMIYQQPNPGVHYEFILPVENPQLHSASSPGARLSQSWHLWLLLGDSG